VQALAKDPMISFIMPLVGVLQAPIITITITITITIR
jgi:hypothetical protein